MLSQQTAIVLVLCCVLPRFLAATLVLGLLLLSGSPGVILSGGFGLFAVLRPALFFCLCGVLVPLAYLVPWLLSSPRLPSPHGVVICDHAVADAGHENGDDDESPLGALAAPVPPSGGFSVCAVASCSIAVVSAPSPLPPVCGDGLSERLPVASVALPTEGLSASAGAVVLPGSSVSARPPLPPTCGDGSLEHLSFAASVAPPTEALSAPAGAVVLPGGSVSAPSPLPLACGDGHPERLSSVVSAARPLPSEYGDGYYEPFVGPAGGWPLVSGVGEVSPSLSTPSTTTDDGFPSATAAPSLFLGGYDLLGWADRPFPLGGILTVAPILGGSLVVPPVSPVVPPAVEAGADADVPGLALEPGEVDQGNEGEDDRVHGDQDHTMGIQEEVAVDRGVSVLRRRARRRRLMALPLGIPARRLAGPYIIPWYMGSSSIGCRRRDTKTGALVEDMDCQ